MLPKAREVCSFAVNPSYRAALVKDLTMNEPKRSLLDSKRKRRTTDSTDVEATLRHAYSVSVGDVRSPLFNQGFDGVKVSVATGLDERGPAHLVGRFHSSVFLQQQLHEFYGADTGSFDQGSPAVLLAEERNEISARLAQSMETADMCVTSDAAFTLAPLSMSKIAISVRFIRQALMRAV